MNISDTNFLPLHYSDCPVYEILADIIGSAGSELYECIANEEDGQYIIKFDGEEKLLINTETRQVTINGESLDLTRNQLAVVIATFKPYQQGHYENLESRLCGLAEHVKSDRLRDVFRSHPEHFRSLYIKTRSRIYKLNI